ncbi:MAG: methyl-accepting chemotaxis protein [Candidatus Omnitrophica bacterium]|nr:methyl-accepting chemotaxis protein [Candidatus Omnitrophota bacterium]
MKTNIIRNSIQRKIFILVLLLYPAFAVAGFTAMKGIERVGVASRETLFYFKTLTMIQQERLLLDELTDCVTDPNGQDTGMTAYELKRAANRVQEHSNAILLFLDENQPLFQSLSEDVHAFIDVLVIQKRLDRLLKEIGRRAGLGQTVASVYADISQEIVELDSLLDKLLIRSQVSWLIPYRTEVTSLIVIGLSTMAIMLIVGIGGGIFISRHINGPLRTLTDFTRRLAELKGDLQYRFQVKGNDEISELASSFNDMTGNFCKLMRGIRDIGFAVSSFGEEFKHKARSQSLAAKSQSAKVIEVSMTLRDFVNAAHTIARSARGVEKMAQDALLRTQKSFSVIERNIRAFQGIKHQVNEIGQTVLLLKEKSRSINQITAMIKELSVKTDMLAINASIQASRDSETRQGDIGVISEQVKGLSEKTKEAAGEIESILTDIMQEIERSVAVTYEENKKIEEEMRLTDDTKSSVEEIAKMVNETVSAAGDITRLTDEQINSTEGLRRGVSDIDAMAKGLAGESDRLSQQALELESLAADLRRFIEEFKLD